MLGEPFFATGYELVKATSFDRVAELLLNQLRPQVGASEIILFDIAADFSSVGVIGDGPQARILRQDLESVRLWIGTHFRRCPDDTAPISGGPNGEELSKAPDVASWLKEIGAADLIGCNLMHGMHRSATMAILREGRPFDADERERIQAAVLVTSGVLLRLLNQNYERRVLERLMNKRNEANNAVIFLKEGRAVPYNPGAVAYADACWEKDEVDFKVSDHYVGAVHAAVMGAWASPVDCRWVDLEVDLGGGPLKAGAIAHPNQGVFLYFTPPPRQAVAATVPMLTRRQCDIMDWIAEGKTSAEVAIILDISPRTVEKHLEAVFQRFGVENRVAAVRTYLEAKGGLFPGHAH